MAAGNEAKIWMTGGCHCGAVRFRVRAAPDQPVVLCSCSICRMTAYLHLIVPAADFLLEQGAEMLTEYRFGTRTARHLFCRVCGIKSFYHPRSHPEGISVNARCLDPGQHRPAREIPFDGANWEQAIRRGDLDALR